MCRYLAGAFCATTLQAAAAQAGLLFGSAAQPGKLNSFFSSAAGTSGAVQFSNVSYDGRVAAGQSVGFGFQGTGSAAGVPPSCTAT